MRNKKINPAVKIIVMTIFFFTGCVIVMGECMCFASAGNIQKNISVPVYNSEDGSGSENERTITIERESRDAPVPEKKEIRVKKAGNAYFELPCDRPGLFSYKVKEKTGKTQSEEISYRILLINTYDDNDDKLSSSVIIKNNNGEKAEKIFFGKTSEKKKNRNVPVTGDKSRSVEKMLKILLIAAAVIIASGKGKLKIPTNN